MNRLIKILTIWMLLLVLPAQAMASAIKISCGPSHHSISSAGATASEHAHENSDHGIHQHKQVADSVNDRTLPDLPEQSEKFKSSYCSACAACCIGLAMMPSSAEWSPEYSSAFIPVIPSSSLFTGHIPAGPERPPRLFLV